MRDMWLKQDGAHVMRIIISVIVENELGLVPCGRVVFAAQLQHRYVTVAPTEDPTVG